MELWDALTRPRRPLGLVDRVARSIRKVAAARAGVRIDECVFLARGTLPKTPSGKIQRFRCRRLARDASAPVLERVEL